VTDVMSEQQPWTTQKQDEIRAAKEAMAGPVPIIGEAPDTLLTLPRGLFHNGQWQRAVVARELTGADEETLAKVPDQLAFYSTVIALGIESIGELDLASMPLAARKSHLAGLLLGERDMLFVKVVQTSFGDEKDINFNCSLCETEQTMTLILSEDFQANIPEDTSIDHQFTTSKGDVLDYRAGVGSDQDEATSKKGATLAEQNTIMLSRCVTKCNGDLIVDPLKFVRNLGISDRSKLLKELIALQPSIDMELKTKCAGCGGDQTVALGWGDIFRP
jgi:hypothetical protein